MNIGATAVLAIDLQDEYRCGFPYPVECYDAILANAARVIAAARAAGAPVIHVQAWVEEAAARDYHLLHDGLADGLKSGVPHSQGARICAEVAPLEGEPVVRKSWPSAFRDTDLAKSLAARGLEHLIVTGVWTDSCVRVTVFDAVYAGFRVWLVKDACGSGTETMHRTAVLDMANRLYGGGVLTAAAAVDALRGSSFRAWTCARPVALQYTTATIDGLYDGL